MTKYFPWKAAARAFFLQTLGFLVGVVAIGYLSRHYVASILLELGYGPSDVSPHDHPFIERFDQILTAPFVLVLTCGLIWFMFVTYLGLRPMARIARLARHHSKHLILDADIVTRVESDDREGDHAYVDEPGEWQDLERMVESLTTGLKTREAQLVREREELVTILGSVNEAIVAMGKETEPLFFNSRFAVLFGAGSTGGDALPLRERFRVPELLKGFDR
ncbi:MAG: hypothetical protein RBT63_05870, partial [Bdellovibrionales bacterium]|nr:hypothetical protein [Bdellovibrionales bacterium]